MNEPDGKSDPPESASDPQTRPPSLADSNEAERRSVASTENGAGGTSDGHAGDVEVLGDSDDKDTPTDPVVYTTDSNDTVDAAALQEKGSFFWITIGVTYHPVSMTSDGQKIPQHGVGIFFDHAYIPIRFKTPIQNQYGVWYRPEMRFWSQEDAKVFAQSIAAKFRFKLDPTVFGSATIPESPIDPISQALELVKDAGMKVNNLYQDSDGRWRCSMKQENYFDFGEGSSAVEAIEVAIHNTGVMSQLSYSAAKRKRR